MHTQEREVLTLSAMFEAAGLGGVLGLLVGLAVLVLGIRCAARRGPRGHALALLAAPFVPVPLAFVTGAIGAWTAWREIVLLGPAVTPKDMAVGPQAQAAAMACNALAVLLGLCGAIPALARSRGES